MGNKNLGSKSPKKISTDSTLVGFNKKRLLKYFLFIYLPLLSTTPRQRLGRSHMPLEKSLLQP